MQSDTLRKNLFIFFVLAYLFTWVFAIPLAFLWKVGDPIRWWALLFLPLPYGPSVAAALLSYRLEGRQGLKRLLALLGIWRVHWKWYLVALLVPFAVSVVAVALSSFRDEALVGFTLERWYWVLPMMLIGLPFGPLAEELGWRGYALSGLRQRFGLLTASLILGLLWTFWHTPMFWIGTAFPPSLRCRLVRSHSTFSN